MRIATDPALIGFEERRGDSAPPLGCRCLHCVAQHSGRRSGPSARAARGPQLARTVRGACLATTVLAGAGVVGLGLGAAPAGAVPAPSRAGWDGSKYWFRSAGGEWRYTRHYDVYLSRTAGAAGSASTSGGSDAENSGIQQGWDGSRYWFQNAGGEWRYTAHYDVYLSRTSGGSSEQEAPAGGDTGSDSSSGTETAVDYALAQLGKPYVWGGDGPEGYDCSGLVQQAYERAGIDLPRVADDQYVATTPISSGELRRGDLLFWSDSSRASGIHHVAIYLGGGSYVEAPRPGRTVRISTLSRSYYPTHLGRPS
ncbi:cell wall-associated NlpC family hydrolase [Kitasatospora sp. MAP12-15]|uniref:C40 family peptidase n=1 Tax=unclassified Kitasatospora TaxID=2633591 RepID=UPI00247412B5|nr:C40 family peptidase [Kitasatospora sp. MAP12-44]MDH6111659.1 cell wall-associated NlpC family hydrolase [Kitasatospora sp. MAP12-44]